MNNKLKIAFISTALVTALTGCTRVEPNMAGVLMENYGRTMAVMAKATFRLFPAEYGP